MWRAVDEVYGSAYGRSLVSDLVLGGLGCTGAEALARGVAPREVWNALCDETEATDQQRWVYREDTGRKRAR